jgi:3-oxoacyl-[acyl-carrier-protein] synthase II
MKRVVITGMGTINPIGNSVEEFSEGLKNSKNGIDFITKFDTRGFKTTFAGEVKNFDFPSYFSVKEARKLDDFTKYALVAADEAIQKSKIDLKNLNMERCGVIWGSAIGGMRTFQDEILNFQLNGRLPNFSPYFIPKIIPDIVSGTIAIKYGFMGINFALVSACASSTHAIIIAYQNIKLGKADLVITGGSEAAITESGIGGFNAFKGLSQRNNDPKTASRPFDIDRDGFVVGEGAGALVMEELEHAKARNANILCEITGTGMTCDAHHITASHPDGTGAYLALKEALHEANCSISEIDYINAHATSTQLGDMSEMSAINRLKEESKTIPVFHITSTKSMIGHLLGAAGAVELIATIISMQEGFIPHTINTQQIDALIPLHEYLLINKPLKKAIRQAASLNFGFGGHNAAVIISSIGN